MSEFELEEKITASRSGAREAFGWLIAKYQNLVCSAAYSLTGDIDQSKDLAHRKPSWPPGASSANSARPRNSRPGSAASPATWPEVQSGTLRHYFPDWFAYASGLIPLALYWCIGFSLLFTIHEQRE